MNNNCTDCNVYRNFSGVESNIKNLQKEDEELWQGVITERKRIDGIKNWVIAGMTSMILNLIGTIFVIILNYLKLKGSP